MASQSGLGTQSTIAHRVFYLKIIYIGLIGFVTVDDEDHISDLPNLRNNISIPTLHKHINFKEQLRSLKLESGPISSAMESLLGMINTYTGGPPSPAPEFPRVKFKSFWNRYPSDFRDTNNISLVTFLDCDGLKFVIPKMEKQGWRTSRRPFISRRT